MTVIRFPEGFLWGASTAAHQIEGNNTHSDWWAREHEPDTELAQPSGDAADSYHRYPEDMALLAGFGLNTYRFSIEWARIEPEEGFVSKAQLLHYRRMVDTCLEAGLTPSVTLHHFTHPRWFAQAGGWRNPAAPDLFARYTETILPVLGDDVEWVCTINEPNMVAMTRGEEGTEMTPSKLPGPDALITERLIQGHIRSREVLSSRSQVRSGWAVAAQAYHAASGADEATKKYGYPREDIFWEAAAGDDWVGVQAYLRTFIDVDGQPLPVPEGAEVTQMGWEYFPPAIEMGIRNAWELTKGVPIVVTENGIATADDKRRIDYTYDALRGVHAAMADGIDVRGYLHWSALDNYEWGTYAPTFGLIGWDKDTFERQPKPSATWLGGVAQSGELTHPHR